MITFQLSEAMASLTSATPEHPVVLKDTCKAVCNAAEIRDDTAQCKATGCKEA